MEGKIIGGYEFTNKKGNVMASICITDTSRVNVIGCVANCYLAMKKNMPCDLKDMMNKTYIVDKDNIGLLCKFYEVK